MRGIDLHDPTYTPRRLFLFAAGEVGVRSVSELSYRLGVDPAQVSRVINRRQRLSGDILVALMDHTGWSLTKLRELAGIPAPVVKR